MTADDDRASALRLIPVSRETEDRLSLYVDLLRHWQKIKNLVAPSTLPYIWTRHVADSAQLLDIEPDARHWVDLGSGGGFPGLVVAIRLARNPDALVHLIESDQRKCAFLRDVIRRTEAPANVHCGRVETIVPTLPANIDVVSARALAPLKTLIDSAKTLLMTGATGLFPKGRHYAAELTEATILPTPYDIGLVTSRIDSESRIVRVRARAATRD